MYRLDTSAVTLSPKRSVKLIKPQTGCPLRGQVVLRSKGAQQASQGLSKTIHFISARRLGASLYVLRARPNDLLKSLAAFCSSTASKAGHRPNIVQAGKTGLLRTTISPCR